MLRTQFQLLTTKKSLKIKLLYQNIKVINIAAPVVYFYFKMNDQPRRKEARMFDIGLKNVSLSMKKSSKTY